MKTSIIVDAGPLVAYFDRDAEHHDWVREQATRLEPGWLTSEAVLGEASFPAPIMTASGERMNSGSMAMSR